MTVRKRLGPRRNRSGSGAAGRNVSAAMQMAPIVVLVAASAAIGGAAFIHRDQSCRTAGHRVAHPDRGRRLMLFPNLPGVSPEGARDVHRPTTAR